MTTVLLRALAMVGLAGTLTACAGSTASAAEQVLGVYENPEKTASIEFTRDGKAHFSLYGAGMACRFTQSGAKVTLNCDGDAMELTVGEDGALSGPPETYLARLKKNEK